MGAYGGGGSDGAAEMRQAEIERQAKIDTGLTRIDNAFAGKRGINPATGYNPNETYYDEFGEKADPTKNPKGKLFTGWEQSGGFDDKFYDQRKQDYENFALPTLSDQYNNTLAQTTYNLAGRGLLHSGAADFLDKSLNREMNTQKNNIANVALAQSQQLRSNVNQQKNQLIAQLQASADPSTAGQQALGAASQFSAPSAFQPIGQMLGDWQNIYLAKNMQQNYQPMTSGSGGGFSSPSFGTPIGSSSRVIR